MELTNLLTRVDWNTGAASGSRFAICPFLGIGPRLGLRPLRPVLGGALLSVWNTHGIQRATHHVIANSRQVLHAAAANEHDGVLLQVVADAGNISRHLDAVG